MRTLKIFHCGPFQGQGSPKHDIYSFVNIKTGTCTFPHTTEVSVQIPGCKSLKVFVS